MWILNFNKNLQKYISFLFIYFIYIKEMSTRNHVLDLDLTGGARPRIHSVKAKSACHSLPATACASTAGCKYITPTKVSSKTNRVGNPYCRSERTAGSPKVRSACYGLDQTSCLPPNCRYVAQKKATSKSGRGLSSYCRTARKTK